GVRCLVGQRHQLARGRERPGMVEAAEVAAVARLRPGEHRAPVGAGVEVDLHLAVLVAHEQQVATTYDARAVVAELWDLALMTEVQPQLRPELPLLGLEHCLRPERLTPDTERASRTILGDPFGRRHA